MDGREMDFPMLQRARVVPAEFDHPSTWGSVDPVGRHFGRKGQHGFNRSARPLLSPQTATGEDDNRLLRLRYPRIWALSWPPSTGNRFIGGDAPLLHFWTSRYGCRVDRPAGARHPLFALALCLASKTGRIRPARRRIADGPTASRPARGADDRAVPGRSAILRAGMWKDSRNSDREVDVVASAADQSLLQRSEGHRDARGQKSRSRSEHGMAVASRPDSENRSRSVRAIAFRRDWTDRRTAMVWRDDLAAALRSPLVMDGIAADRRACRFAWRQAISVSRDPAYDGLAHGRPNIDRRGATTSWPHNSRADAEVSRSANLDDRYRRCTTGHRLIFVSSVLFSPAGAFSVNQRAPAGILLTGASGCRASAPLNWRSLGCQPVGAEESWDRIGAACRPQRPSPQLRECGACRPWSTRGYSSDPVARQARPAGRLTGDVIRTLETAASRGGAAWAGIFDHLLDGA